MSQDFNIYLSSKSLPSPFEWQAEIAKVNKSLIMDTDFDLLTYSGFLPCQLDNKITGFEYYSWFIDDEHKKEINIPNVDFCILFSVGSHPFELITAVTLAYSLVKLTDGILSNAQKGIHIPPSQIDSWKIKILAEQH
ncbi:hypothetical protein [Proteus faecis]|uniref:hypothetical protein n=1 Tax=Proteus faecis TaxID=2050967 RepID=UPI0018C642DD|nr:hypothetical protein [Proteus faecis]MBG3012900.1 hypothetical protein [Proteus mirabilis]